MRAQTFVPSKIPFPLHRHNGIHKRKIARDTRHSKTNAPGNSRLDKSIFAFFIFTYLEAGVCGLSGFFSNKRASLSLLLQPDIAEHLWLCGCAPLRLSACVCVSPNWAAWGALGVLRNFINKLSERANIESLRGCIQTKHNSQHRRWQKFLVSSQELYKRVKSMRIWK
jgi:hypothetical protein